MAGSHQWSTGSGPQRLHFLVADYLRPVVFENPPAGVTDIENTRRKAGSLARLLATVNRWPSGIASAMTAALVFRLKVSAFTTS